MKSPIVWCLGLIRNPVWRDRAAGTSHSGSASRSSVAILLLMAALVACPTGIGLAQDQVVGDDGYVLTDPFASGEPESGFRFQADALIWARTNSGNSGPIIGGPQTFSFSELPKNNYVGGYRVGGGWLIDPNYEVEGIWTWFSDWNSSSGGVLSRSIAFNGGINSPLVDPSGNANFINAGTYFRPLFAAAMDPLGNPTIQNYAFLAGGSTYSLYSTSTLHDVQANFKTRRGDCRRFSFGVGYRNIQLNESNSALITGAFATNDLPGGGTTFNVLTNDALVANGLSPIAGTPDGWVDNAGGPPTLLSLFWNGSTTNQLNGGQLTMDGAMLELGGFTLEAVVRAGLFFNHMTGTVQELYVGSGADDSVYGRQLSDERDVVAFAGNFGLNGLFQVSEHVKLRAGYELMVLTNTALGGDQQGGVTYNSLGQASYSVQGGSTAVFHGLRAGVEVVW